jgi:glycosyltransferase involved in cell wall biosynthesis
MSARPKVLYLTHWYPTPEAPVDGIFNRERAKASALFADVQVLHCAGPDPRLRTLWRLEQVDDPAITEGIPTFRVFHRSLPRRLSYAAYVWGAVGAYRALAGRGFRPDVIHAAVYQAAVPAVLLGRATGTPVVVTEYSSGYARGLHDRVNRAKTRFALQRAQRVLVQSAAQQHAIEETGIHARFEIAESPVDIDLFRPASPPAPDPRSRLLFVGLLGAAHVKGMPVLLASLARLSEQRADWALDVVGDGQARPEYERKVEQLGLSGHVTFHGLQPKAAVAELMRQASLLVLANTIWDTSPNVVAEAQATGLPVVATSVGGIPEMVSASTGILVPPNDANALAAALERALSCPQAFDRARIATAARARWSMPVAGARLAAVYEAVLAERGAGTAG